MPYLPTTMETSNIKLSLKNLIDEMIFEEEILDYTCWYFSPKYIDYTRHLKPGLMVFDCFEELALLENNPGPFMTKETELMRRADLVFTSSFNLFQSKKHAHHNIHLIPNGVDHEHFVQARERLVEPDDLINIPHPRIGFFGTVDERFNHDLLMQLADLKPSYHFIVVGPIKKNDDRVLPKRTNIHYLKQKDYHALPLYLAGWDAVFFPFTKNESSKFISPVEILEALASGKQIVSTKISELVSLSSAPFVHLADSPEDFIYGLDLSMATKNDHDIIKRIDQFLDGKSWNNIFNEISFLESRTNKPAESFNKPRITQPVGLNVIGVL
jgi:glycosyltransferase involved in cell wall biosynthesis